MTVAIQFSCLKCGQALRVDDRFAGKRVRCSRCGEIATAPAQPHPPSPPTVRPKGIVRLPVVSRKETEEIEPVCFINRKSEEAELDMTPMIDCVFLLLIFFTVTASFTLQKSFEIPTPDEDKAAVQERVADPEEGNIVVRIDKDNTIWVNDSEAPSEQDLLVKLREAKRGVPGSDSPPINSLLVMADGEARHEVVVMALDAGNAVGMEPIKLATVNEDDL
jgi:biopolymer transport protein ExbD